MLRFGNMSVYEKNVYTFLTGFKHCSVCLPCILLLVKSMHLLYNSLGCLHKNRGKFPHTVRCVKKTLCHLWIFINKQLFLYNCKGIRNALCDTSGLKWHRSKKFYLDLFFWSHVNKTAFKLNFNDIW